MNAMAGIFVLGLAFVFLTAASAAGESVADTAGDSAVTIRYWGHACFTMTAGGKTLLIDPYNEKVGYEPFKVAPDVVAISHEHFDHADTSWLQGKPEVVRGLASDGSVASIDRTVGPFHLRTVAAHHWDDEANAQRGNNAIFVIKISGLTVVHLGDLGRVLDEKQVAAIGRPDVLLVPVGGFYTIDAAAAEQVVRKLRPRGYVVPMHYRTAAAEPSLASKIAGPDGFLRRFDEVVRLGGNELRIDPADMPSDMKVVLMDYRPGAAGKSAVATQSAGKAEGNQE